MKKQISVSKIFQAFAVYGLALLGVACGQGFKGGDVNKVAVGANGTTSSSFAPTVTLAERVVVPSELGDAYRINVAFADGANIVNVSSLHDRVSDGEASANVGSFEYKVYFLCGVPQCTEVAILMAKINGSSSLQSSALLRVRNGKLEAITYIRNQAFESLEDAYGALLAKQP